MELYRPTWTCGKYNPQYQIAIYYNLIEGMVYTFEDYSAEVIGKILEVPKGKSFSLDVLSDETNISTNSLIPFIDELIDLGLLSRVPITDDVVKAHRELKKRISYNSSESLKTAPQFKDYPVDMNDAELYYHENCDCISSVMLELTYNCSARCIHCYNIGASRNAHEIGHRCQTESLNIDEYRNIIDQFVSYGIVKVCLTGGDPFSYPKIWEIIDYLYNKDIAIDIYTNGIIPLGAEDRLASYFPRIVGISLYSNIADVHDSITQIKGSWEKTTNFIARLAYLSVPMVVKCCIMKPNFKSYHTVKQFADNYGIPVQYDVNVTDSIEGDKYVSKFLRLSSEMLELVLCDKNVYLSINNTDNKAKNNILTNIAPCMAGHRTFCVTPNGMLIPCCAFHLELGNLRKDKLSDILSQSSKLKEWVNTTIADLKECGTHDYCSMCCLCAGLNYSEHEDYHVPAENNCYLAKIRFNLIKRLNEGDYTVLNETKLRERIAYFQDEELYPHQILVGNSYTDK